MAGTHDNETAVGWWKDSAGELDREYLSDYLGSDGADIAWDLIRASFASVSRVTIVMMQVRVYTLCKCEERWSMGLGACSVAAQKCQFQAVVEHRGRLCLAQNAPDDFQCTAMACSLYTDKSHVEARNVQHTHAMRQNLSAPCKTPFA